VFLATTLVSLTRVNWWEWDGLSKILFVEGDRTSNQQKVSSNGMQYSNVVTPFSSYLTNIKWELGIRLYIVGQDFWIDM